MKDIKPITVQPEAGQRGGMKDKLVPVLVALVVVAAFAMGLMYGKLSVYEKGGVAKGGETGDAQPTNQAQGPEEPVQLTDSLWQELLAAKGQEKGEASAKVTIVEFTDYECPFCGRFVTDTYGKIMDDYVKTGKVKYALFDLPLPFHANAKTAALTALCAGDQGKYWEMHEKLFSTQEAWSSGDPKTKFQAYAKEIGLNTSKYDKCVTDGQFNQAIEDSTALAQKMGANGTPTFYINGKQLVGAQPYSEFQKVIDEALK